MTNRGPYYHGTNAKFDFKNEFDFKAGVGAMYLFADANRDGGIAWAKNLGKDYRQSKAYLYEVWLKPSAKIVNLTEWNKETQAIAKEIDKLNKELGRYSWRSRYNNKKNWLTWATCSESVHCVFDSIDFNSELVALFKELGIDGLYFIDGLDEIRNELPDTNVPALILFDTDPIDKVDVYEVDVWGDDVTKLTESKLLGDLQALIESVVRETLQELAPEAPEDAPFGQYLFAPDRKDLEPEERKETNTEEEMRFRDALFNHYQGDSHALAQLATKIKAMVDKGWYEKILAPPDQTVYRYISNVDMKVAAKFLRTSVADLEDGAGRVQKYGSGHMVPGGPYQKGGIHSWSTELGADWILSDLHPPSLQPGQTAMIIAAKPSDKNFFIDPKGIQLVGRMPSYAYYQNEVISHGPIDFERAWVLSNSKKGTWARDALAANDVIRKLLKNFGF